ncbi:MAG: hypothetical protein RL425_820 [Pseudomonadota bacterium]
MSGHPVLDGFQGYSLFIQILVARGLMKSLSGSGLANTGPAAGVRHGIWEIVAVGAEP